MGWKRLVAGLFTSAMLIAGCGDDASDSGSSGAEEKKITGNKVIDLGAMDTAKGNISFCTGKDTSGTSRPRASRRSTRPTPASRSS